MLLTETQTAVAPQSVEINQRTRWFVRVGGQSVEIPAGKTTVGSSPRCTLRIQQETVQPLHCLIVNEAERLAVRRWADDTRLNGQFFNEAPLEAGDCISLAGVELVVGVSREKPNAIAAAAECAPVADEKRPIEGAVTGPACKEAPVKSAADQTAGAPEIEPASMGLSSLWAAEEVFRRLQIANGTARGRARKLIMSLRALKREADEMRVRLAEAEYASAAYLDERRKWGNLRDELQAKLSEAEEERARSEDEKADMVRQRVELENERAQWNRRDASLAEKSLFVSPDGLRQQIGDWEARLAENVRRLEELQRELAAVDSGEVTTAESAAPEPVELVTAVLGPATTACEAAEESVEEGREQCELFDGSEANTSEECRWESRPSTAIENTPAGALLSKWLDDAEPECQTAEAVVSVEHESDLPSYWRAADSVSDARDETEAECQSSGLPVTFTTPVEDCQHSDGEDGGEARAESDAADTWGGTDSSEEIWPERVSESPDGGRFFGGSGAREVADDNVADEQINGLASTAGASQPVSFIERYAGMFDDDEDATTPAPIETQQPLRPEDALFKPRTSGVVREATPTATTDDEESIEQYMAKLLQRVRGDSPVPTPVKSEARPVLRTGEVEPADAARGDEEAAETEIPAAEPVMRRAPAPMAPADLGVLRALANETARRAIGTHQLRKHRRDGTRKFIIATLAGMTSLWLMLQSPDWRDRQFIAACVALVVAAYWAGQAYRNVLESCRAASYDGPKGRTGDADVEQENRLPIDV